MTENIPKDKVAILLGPASEEIVKITALLGVSGFLFEIALTIAPAKFGAIFATFVVTASL